MRFRLKTLTEAREIVRTGKPCDITFCTFDEKRGTGGKRERYEQCTLVKGSESSGEAAPASTAPGSAASSSSKNPHHLMHGTFNVKLKGSSEMRKIHWLLIEMINGFQVVM